ncbi:MAG: 3-isopropylmalate dehydrogenase [Parvularculaceae bacterium]
MAAASDASVRKAFSLLVLPGDGIGVEITQEALRIVEWFERHFPFDFTLRHGLAGGASIDVCGAPLTDDVFAMAEKADAILFGAVGGPKWDHLPRAERPEMGILRLRKGLDLYANLRPAAGFPELAVASSLRPEVLSRVDMIFVRESSAGVYFGEPRGNHRREDGSRYAVDTQAYTEEEIARACRAAFTLARERTKRVCSVDKANVMETGALWRAVATEIARDFPDIELVHMYADNCAMQLLRRPEQFDVIVTDNLFGDILSDEAAALSGSLGLLPSATLGAQTENGLYRGLYEPIHGSAPDIAGKGIANPIASILSFAMCLRFSLGAPMAGDLLERAVRRALANGARTPDIAAAGDRVVSCSQMSDAILESLDALASRA